MSDKKIRKGRQSSGKNISAEEFMDFEKYDFYKKKYHSEQRWVFAGDKYSNNTISGNFYFTTVTIKTETGEICDISVGAKPEPEGDYYRIIPYKNSSHCSEDKMDSFVENAISNIKAQLSERLDKITPEQIFYAFDLEKGGCKEHLFFEHQEDWNNISKLEEFKSYRNNKFY